MSSKLSPVSRSLPTLRDFEALDERLISLEAGNENEIAADSESLALGQLAEVLVLRKSFPKLKLRSRGGNRHRLLQQAMTSTGGVFTETMGAYQVDPPGDDAELRSTEFGEHLARAAGAAGLAARPALLLKGAAAELISNIHMHAGDAPRGLAAFEVFDGGVVVAVADAGQGVVQAYVSANPALAGLSADEALERAVVEHRSRLELIERGRGTGFITVANAMRSLGAMLRVRSCDASLEIEGHPDDAEWTLVPQVDLRGFVVSLTLCWR